MLFALCVSYCMSMSDIALADTADCIPLQCEYIASAVSFSADAVHASNISGLLTCRG